MLFRSWQDGERTFLDFSAGYGISNDLFAELLGAIEKGTFSDGDNDYEVPQKLDDIQAIIMKSYCEEITKLPEVIQRCTSLKEINLSGSSVKEIPNWLAKMEGVKVIAPAAKSVPTAQAPAPGKTSDDWVNEGCALFELNQKDEAIKCANEALRLDPNNAFAINMLAKFKGEPYLDC